MLWLLAAVAAADAQAPVVPSCSHRTGMGLVKILARLDSGEWGPTQTHSHTAARDLCAQFSGTLPTVTPQNAECVFSAGNYGSKIRLPVNSASDSCMFMYNNKKTYAGSCDESAHMSDQDDYIVCEVPMQTITPDFAVVGACSENYDMCGVCGGPARSCADCTDGCLSPPPPEPSSSSGGGFVGEASGAYFASMLVVVVVLVLAVVALVVRSKQRRGHSRNERVEKPDMHKIVSFENPRYKPGDPDKEDSPTYMYDQITGDQALQGILGGEDSRGYLVPAAALRASDSVLDRGDDEDNMYYSAAVDNESGEPYYSVAEAEAEVEPDLGCDSDGSDSCATDLSSSDEELSPVKKLMENYSVPQKNVGFQPEYDFIPEEKEDEDIGNYDAARDLRDDGFNL